MSGQRLGESETLLSYHQALDRTLRRRAAVISAVMSLLLVVAFTLFFAFLSETLQASLVQHLQDDAEVALRLVANEIPLSLLTEPLSGQQEPLAEARRYLQRVVAETGARRLWLIRLTSDGSYTALIEIVRSREGGLEVYEGVPVALPFRLERWEEPLWVGPLVQEQDGEGRLHRYLPLYLLLRDGEGEVVGALGVEYPLGEMEAIVNQVWGLGFLFAAMVTGAAVLLGWWVMRRASRTMRAFLLPVDNILRGDFSLRHPPAGTPLERSLFDFVNLAAEVLEVKFQTLERKVKEAREAMERRAGYLAATAQVGRVASSILSVDELLEESVKLIARYFSFYHVGLFLVDDSRTWAVLKAASSEGGKRMLARKHRLQLGQGVVGYAAQTGRPRIASDVDVDVVWVPNPDLPETRSEMAVPMSVRGNVVGVLDVQSTEPAAFTAEDVATLRVLAGQLAVAIENARLFRESRIALEEARALQMEEIRRGWQRWRQHLYGYRYDMTQSEPITAPLESVSVPLNVKVERATNTITAPLIWGGFVIGFLRLTREPARPWTGGEIKLVEAAVADISQALENARLLEEIRERARVEQAVSQIATRLQALFEPELILKEAVRQLGATLEIDYAVIEVEPSIHGQQTSSEGEAGEAHREGEP